MALVFSQANEATRQEVPGQSSRTRNNKSSDGQISVICFGIAKCVTCAKVKAWYMMLYEIWMDGLVYEIWMDGLVYEIWMDGWMDGWSSIGHPIRNPNHDES